MKVSTLNHIHNSVNYGTLATVAGGILVAAAPTTLPVTIAAVTTVIFSTYTNKAFRHALGRNDAITEENRAAYKTTLREEFSLKNMAWLLTVIGLSAIICVQVSDLLAPPPQAIRRV